MIRSLQFWLSLWLFASSATAETSYEVGSGNLCDLPASRHWRPFPETWSCIFEDAGMAEARGLDPTLSRPLFDHRMLPHLKYDVRGVLLGQKAPFTEYGFVSSRPWSSNPLLSSLLLPPNNFVNRGDWKSRNQPGLVLLDFFCFEKDAPVLQVAYQAPNLKVLIFPFAGFDQPIEWQRISANLEELYIYRKTIALDDLLQLRRFPKLRVLQLIECATLKDQTIDPDALQQFHQSGALSHLEELDLSNATHPLGEAFRGVSFPSLKKLLMAYPGPGLAPLKTVSDVNRIYPRLEQLTMTIGPASPPESQEEFRANPQQVNERLLQLLKGRVPKDANIRAMLKWIGE